MIEFKALLPGFMGALLAAFTGPKRDSADRTLGFLTGFSFAVFLTGPALDYFKLLHDTYADGVGFVLGFFGMTLADAALRVFRAVEWASILDLIKSHFGGGKDK